MSGAFIVFEGADGAGKSSLCRRIADTLTERGMEVFLTAEPTHEGIGAFIRSGGAGDISQRTEALLFVADRNDHTEKIKRMVSEERSFSATGTSDPPWHTNPPNWMVMPRTGIGSSG